MQILDHYQCKCGNEKFYLCVTTKEPRAICPKCGLIYLVNKKAKRRLLKNG